VSFAPNPAYSGTQRPELSGVAYYAYPSDASEYAALRAGRLDVGYVPAKDLPPEATDQAPPAAGTRATPAPRGQVLTVDSQSLLVATPLGSAFTLSPSYAGGVSYVQLNYRSAALGPVYRQLYLRQALQQLISRAQMIGSADNGYGYALSGIVPAQPSNPWVPPDQVVADGAGPFSYSEQSAAFALAGHGWKQVGGVLTCEAAGAGGSRCGAGIAAGTRLAMTVEFPAGDALLAAEAAGIQADFAAAGVRASLVHGPPLTSGGGAAPCPSGHPGCAWDLVLSPGGWGAVGFEPTGEQLLAPGNVGGYSDQGLDTYLALVRANGSLTLFQRYAGYVADQVPLLWLPAPYTVVATRSSLAEVAFSPLGTQLPEYWFFTR
jgi:peptide/nickel transport system substrate-binding protein